MPTTDDRIAHWAARRQRQLEHHRAKRAASPHGVAKAERLAEQGGACAICGGAPADPLRWCLDHDHAHCRAAHGCPECWRGVLCTSCNALLGANGEDADRMLAGHALKQGRVSVLVRTRAAQYLERWRA